MATRTIVENGDPILGKVCKPVEKFDQQLRTLLDDMRETLIEANGAGLAAPQVGNMRRVAVVANDETIVELINPEVIKASGKQRDVEGCLSCPGLWGYVTRPLKCRVRAQDREGQFFEMDFKELGARAALHEIDHLNGRLFLELVDEFVELDEEGNEV